MERQFGKTPNEIYKNCWKSKLRSASPVVFTTIADLEVPTVPHLGDEKMYGLKTSGLRLDPYEVDRPCLLAQQGCNAPLVCVRAVFAQRVHVFVVTLSCELTVRAERSLNKMRRNSYADVLCFCLPRMPLPWQTKVWLRTASELGSVMPAALRKHMHNNSVGRFANSDRDTRDHTSEPLLTTKPSQDAGRLVAGSRSGDVVTHTRTPEHLRLELVARVKIVVFQSWPMATPSFFPSTRPLKKKVQRILLPSEGRFEQAIWPPKQVTFQGSAISAQFCRR